MTLKDLLAGASTLDQLRICIVADTIGLPKGRFFAGALTSEQVSLLTERVTKRREHENDPSRF